MQIGELGRLTGVSARALRHYEDRGLLVPERTTSRYRDYSDEDVTRVAHIQAMISAGLNAATIRKYLNCAPGEQYSTTLEMCPNLRAELEAIADRLAAKQADLRTEERLHELTTS